MTLQFQKYQAAGNDFILIDNRAAGIKFSSEQIKQVCDRKFGVGADGLMLVENSPGLDFNLLYFNADGSQSLCGNGCRAAVQFAASLGLVNGKATFNAFDGIHEAEILSPGTIRLKMNDVDQVSRPGGDFFLNTGSPHHVRFVDSVESYAVLEEGRRIRYSEAYRPGGTNANFVELIGDNRIFVRTYERGVEAETLSCGTGIVAAALAASYRGCTSPTHIKAKGGDLVVEYKVGQSDGGSGHGGMFTEIFLTGPAKMVFQGQLEL